MYLKKEVKMRQYFIYPALLAGSVIGLSGTAIAASPIPSFDKEAVTEYPYMRKGEPAQQDEVVPGVGGVRAPM